MAAPTAAVTPPGLSAPAEIVDPTHHGPWIVIPTAFGLTLVLACCLLRVYVRAVVSPPFWRDDAVCIAATVFAVIQSAIVLFEVSAGVGKSVELINPADVARAQKAVFASDVFYLLTLYLSKCCAASTYLRLTPKKAHNVASWALMGLSTLWVFTSVLAIGINCELEHPWMNIAKQCSDMFARWQVITAFDVITEVCLFGLAIWLIVGLQMPWRLKSFVLIAFGFRLILIAVAIVRLHYLNIGIHSSNLTLDGAEAVIWTQVEVQYSVIALVIACLNSFLKVVNTEYGTGTAENNLEYSTGGSNSRSKAQVSAASFSMNSMNKSGRHDKVSIKVGKRAASKSRSIDEADQNHQSFRPDNTQHWTTVTTGQNRDANSIASNDSRKIIIKKQVAYTVEHEWEPGMEEER